MLGRTLIFDTKGLQLGYIEGTRLDLSGTQRCSYTGATGNLGDLNNGKSCRPRIVRWHVRGRLLGV